MFQMATQYSQDRPNAGAPARRPEGGAANPTARPCRPQQTSSSRFGDTTRTAQRPRTQHPAGARATNASRPANGQARRPANRQPPRRTPPRKRKPNNRFFALIAAAVVLIAIIIAVVCLLRKPNADPVSTTDTPTQAPTVEAFDPSSAEDSPSPEEIDPAQADPATDAANTSHTDSLAAMLGDADAALTGLDADQMAQIDDLNLNSNLPSEWMNILLLGSDERWLTESARTDSMIICSINTESGEVKLTSIMRDLAVDYDEIGQYNGTYRINAANFFGGENLAMRVVNECFGMNIQYYVRVNFYGFQQIAQQLGGIEMDITEAEMNEINYRIVEQAKIAYANGIDESALPNEYLKTYGENTHLDGRQTLAYARIRKLDSDYARSERQRKVLVALMNKLRGADAATLLSVATSALPHVKTNLTADTIISIGMKVLSSGLSDVESFRLPINDSYVQETRDGQDMLYDCDWSKNASELYYFIYE